MGVQDFIEGVFCKRVSEKLNVAQQATVVLSGQKADAQNQLAVIKNQKDQLVASCSLDNKANISTINDLQEQIRAKDASISELQAKIDLINKPIGPTSNPTTMPPDPIFSILPATSQIVALQYWNAHPEVDGVYTARFLGKDPNKTYPIDIKVFALSGQNDFKMRAKVKASNAYVVDIMKANPNLTAHQACDIAAMRIASSWAKPYIYDISNWGRDEYWAFASEVDADECPGDDCDGMGVWKHVAYRIAGIPEALLRCTAGQTQNDLDHFTNHYLASDLTWRHLNSTLLQSSNKTIFDVPKTNDPKDELGIKYVWFSFTDSCCFAQYQTDADNSSVKKAHAEHPFMKHIRIMPKMAGKR
jgi:hypothetical protein